MAQHLTLNVTFEEPGLIKSFFEERFSELEQSIVRCGPCVTAAEYCERHAAMVQELIDDISALAIGMMQLSVKP